MAETAPDALLAADHVDITLGGVEVLQGATASLHKGEIVTIVGPNGAGKTTLVRLLLGLLEPDHGTITRKPGLSIGYMPQKIHIDPAMPMTVGRFLSLGVPGKLSGRGRRRQVLQEVGASQLMQSPLQEISGGELQRVMLARALLRDPDVLVLDEPVQGVDVTGQAELYRLIKSIRDVRGVGVLMVSHDLHVVMAETDRVICLNRHVCCEGHPETVSRHPEFVQLFGDQVASAIAVYSHHHDHSHDAHGNVVEEDHHHDHG